MNDKTAGIERLGVYPTFPRIKSYLKGDVLGLPNWETEDLPNLERYARDGGFTYRYEADPECPEFQYTASNAKGDLTRVSNALAWHAIHSALKGETDWLPTWKRSVAYRYWASHIGGIHQAECRAMFERGEAQQYHSFISIQSYSTCIGNCLAQGWLEWAVNLARRSRALLDIDGFNDGGDNFGRRRTHHFLLRLVSNWQGWPERNTPACAYDEPLFNALIEHWRTDDLELIQHLLLAACDRHTHQARQDNSKGQFFDFAGSGGDAFYVPFEILSILRLRQTLGLANPELDHPIMNTPLGKLMEPSEPYTDELLEGVIARACLEFPELCEGTNIKPAAPVPPASPSAPAAKSWLGKLLGKS